MKPNRVEIGAALLGLIPPIGYLLALRFNDNSTKNTVTAIKIIASLSLALMTALFACSISGGFEIFGIVTLIALVIFIIVSFKSTKIMLIVSIIITLGIVIGYKDILKMIMELEESLGNTI